MFMNFRQSILAPALAMAALGFLPAAHANLTGSVSAVTASPTCGQPSGNTFDAITDVYVRNGPTVGGGNPLPSGNYYIQVTAPSGGTVLSATAPMVISGANINGAACVQLTGLVGAITPTPNNGGEYVIAVSMDNTFPSNATRSTNFKVRTTTPVTPTASVAVYKFYDANVDGYAETTESLIAGWKVQVDDLQPVLTDGQSPTSIVYTGLDLASHLVAEYEPVGNSVLNPYAWVATNAYDAAASSFVFNGPSGGGSGVLNRISVDPTATVPDRVVLFGNVCIGPAVGGRTLGYWSNKNGQADMALLGGTKQLPQLNALTALSGLNLVNPDGSFAGNFNGDYKTFRNWLLNGNAVNMAYMLSVQLSALKLSVLTGKLSPNTMVYAPGSEFVGLNPAGFISIGQLIDYATNQLSSYPLTTAGIATRVQQEMLKNAIDNINNNRASVAQPDGSHCPALAF